MTSDELRLICGEHGVSISLAGFIREADAARLLDVDIRTLQNWRRDQRGPAGVRMGGGWRYSIKTLAEFMTPTVESRKGRKGPEISADDSGENAPDDANIASTKAAL